MPLGNRKEEKNIWNNFEIEKESGGRHENWDSVK
jgi:hypothetical protein